MSQSAADQAKQDVAICEREIAAIKAKLRFLSQTEQSKTANAADEGKNRIRIAWIKIEGLPESAQPRLSLQLSSPIEEKALTKIFDDQNGEAGDKEGMEAVFEGVEMGQATLVVTAHDADIPLGSSAPYDLSTISKKLDAMNPEKEYSTELTLDIIPDVGGAKKEPAAEEAREKAASAASSGEKDKTSTAEEKDKTSFSDEKDKTSPSDEKGKTSSSDEKDNTSSSEEKDKASSSDEKDKTSPSDESPSVEEKEETETSTPADKETPKVPADKETPQVEEKEEKKSPATDAAASSATAAAATNCTVALRLVYQPSAKDQQEELYELLNKTSRRKAGALEKLREAVTSTGRSNTQQAVATRTASSGANSGAGGPAVRAGFLNKPAKKEPSKWLALYNNYLGPDSFIRQVVPVVQNYIIFFGVVGFLHFKGHLLALPPPV